MNIKKELEKINDTSKHFQFNDIDVDPLSIKAIMINEVVPADPYQDFYGQYDADYLKTTIPLFQKAGYNVSSIKDILDLGVYITNAAKIPKTEYTIPREVIEANLLFLEKEIALFPNVRVITVSYTHLDVYKRQEQAITDLIESVALQEAALSHILNAEGEKIQAVVAMEGVTPGNSSWLINLLRI